MKTPTSILFESRIKTYEEVKSLVLSSKITKAEHIKELPLYKQLDAVTTMLEKAVALEKQSKNKQVVKKVATLKRIENLLLKQRHLNGVIREKRLHSKGIRDTFAQYLFNVLVLSGKELTRKEIKSLAEDVNYQVKNIGDFLKVVVDDENSGIIKAGRGKYKLKNESDKIDYHKLF